MGILICTTENTEHECKDGETMNNSYFLLKEIGEIVSGATPKTTDEGNFGGEIAWITPADLSGYTSKYVSGGARSLTQKGYDSCATHMMPAGTVLFSSRAPIGYVVIAQNDICTNQGFKSVVPKDYVDSEFLYYQLKYLKPTIQDMGSGTTFKELSAKRFGNVRVWIPQIREQKRIVARIEELFSELDNGVETLNTVKAQLKVYRQAVLMEAFRGLENFTTLESISERIFDGPFGSNLKTADYTKSGIRVVRLENLKDGWFDDSRQSFVTQEKYDTISEHTVYPTDLIMSTFIADSIKVCFIPEYVGFAVNKADCIGIRLKPGYLQKFVMFFLMTKTAYNSLVHDWSTGALYGYEDGLVCYGTTSTRFDYFYLANDMYLLAKHRMGAQFFSRNEKIITVAYHTESGQNQCSPAVQINDGDWIYLTDEEFSYYNRMPEDNHGEQPECFVRTAIPVELQINTMKEGQQQLRAEAIPNFV